MRVRLLTEALADLDSIAEYIGRHDQRRARSFTHELQRKIFGLASMAESFRVIPRYAASGLRRRVHRSYQIFYIADVAHGIVHVARILHSSRDFVPLLAHFE
jgi:toxin ParE1/3/4